MDDISIVLALRYEVKRKAKKVIEMNTKMVVENRVQDICESIFGIYTSVGFGVKKKTAVFSWA